MKNGDESARTLPPEFDYLRGALGDAVWLLLQKIESEEGARHVETMPRRIILEIDLLADELSLPVHIRETLYFGKAYDPCYTAAYRSGEYHMGTPHMYCPDDPGAYWRGYASTQIN